MDGHDVRDVAYDKLAVGYSNQWELMEDLTALIDYRLYLFYKYHQWLGPGNDMKNMLGLVVSREEFEHKLAKSAQAGLRRRIDADERGQIDLSESAVRERLAQTTAQIHILQLIKRFSLSEFESNCVVLAYAAQLDSKYERLIAYLQDNVTKNSPSVSLAVQLFIPEEHTVEEYISFFDRGSGFTSLFDRDEREKGYLRLKPAVTEFLSAGQVTAPGGMAFFDGAAPGAVDPIVVRPSIADELDAIVSNTDESTVFISGPSSSGRRFHIKHLCLRKGLKCLFVDMETQKENRNAVGDADLLARLMDAGLCFKGLEDKDEEGDVTAPQPAVLDEIMKTGANRLFLITEHPLRVSSDRVAYEICVEPSSLAERVALFEHYLTGVRLEGVTAGELASKFRFEPGQISQAARQAAGLMGITAKDALDSETIHNCCYRQVVHRLDKLALRIRPHYTWEDVVLPEEQKILMRHAVSHIRFQHRVYSEWGFDRKISYGKGLSILFAGVPGTGKTMCAQILARELNMEMYKINISQIVSKYIGETEKNLHAVFREARNSNCILFFDECDALFSKRSEVKDSHDRNANVEVAYLLQQIEEHDGVCILASNLIQNIDAAFMRRITYVVHFPFPAPPARKEIYLRTLPGAAPTDEDIDWDFIAEKFNISGGHIKNIVVSAAFMAASEGKPINMRHILTAAVNELKKNEIVVVREELREYADLIWPES